MDELLSYSTLILSILEEKMKESPSVFKLWFENFNLVSLTDDKAVFTAPTKIRKNILSTKYQKLIAESIEEALGFSLDVSIVTEDELSTAPSV